MSINIQKLIDASLFFLSKDGYPFSKNRLNSFLVMADIKCMEDHTLGITGDTINCFPAGPKLHLTTQILNGYMFTEDWKSHFIKTNENQLLIKQNRLPASLSEAEKIVLKFIHTRYGDLDENSINYVLQSKGMEWHENGSTRFNSFLFFKSLGFSDNESEKRQDIYLDYMNIDKSSLNYFFKRYNACKD